MLRAKSLLRTQKRQFFGLPGEGVVGKEYLKHEAHKVEHAEKSAKLWKNIFLYSSVPVLGAVAVNAFLIEKDHFHHLAEHPPHYKDLPHLHIRRKPFPWGDGKKSFFHNENVQPAPHDE